MPKYRKGSGRVYRAPGRRVLMLDYYVAGRRVRESSGTKNEQDARKILRQRLVAADMGERPIKAFSLEEARLLLIADYERRGIKTKDEVLARIKNHVFEFAGFRKSRKLSSITEAHLDQYIEHRRAEGAANGTINTELSALRRMFRLAAKRQRVARVPEFELLPEAAPRTGFFDRWKFARVLARLPEYWRPPTYFSFLTGWRLQSEVLPLTWPRVDFDAREVRLWHDETKSGEPRLFPFTEELEALLRPQWEARPAGCPWVFQRGGRKLNHPRRLWSRASEEAGFPELKPHDFRRTACRNLVKDGVPEKTAMLMVGWSSREMLDRYNIVAEEDLRHAAD